LEILVGGQVMKNDGRDFERYCKWFKELDTLVRKGAITSSSGVASRAAVSAQWEDFFNKMEEKEDE